MPRQYVNTSLKAKFFAKTFLAGLANNESYEEIAKRNGVFNQNYGRQFTYDNLQRKNVKIAIMQEVEKIEDYSKSSLRKKLSEIINKPDNQAIAVRAIDLGMRSEMMLGEKREIETKVSVSDTLKQAEEAIKTLLGKIPVADEPKGSAIAVLMKYEQEAEKIEKGISAVRE